MSALVDRALRLRTVNLENEDRFLRPRAVLQKIVIVRGRHEDVGEHQVIGVIRCLLRIAHTVTRGKKYPLAVVGRADEFAVGAELRAVCRRHYGCGDTWPLLAGKDCNGCTD